MSRLRTAALVGVAVAALAALGALIGYRPTMVVGLAIPVVLMLGTLILAAPASAVIIYAMLRPVVNAAVFVQVGGVTLGTVWGAGFAIVLVSYWLLVGIRRPLRGRSWLVLVLFVVAYPLFTFGRGDFVYTLSTWVKIASFVLLALACEQIASTRDGQRLIQRAGVVIAVLTVIVIGVAIATDQYGAAYYAGQIEILGQSPHDLASMGVLASTFVWIGAMFGRRKWPYVLLAGMLAVGVTLSLVRTTFLAFALLALWYLIWALRSRSRGAVASATAAFVAAMSSVWFFQDALASRVSDLAFLTSGGGMEFRAGSGRIGIWATVLRAATSNVSSLLFGRGSGASFEAVSATLGAALWSHNDFLELLITGGVGLLLIYVSVVVWLLASTLRIATDPCQSHRTRSAGRLMTVVVVSFTVMSFFNGIIYSQSSMVMAMVAGLANGMAATPGATYLDEGETVANEAAPRTIHGTGTIEG